MSAEREVAKRIDALTLQLNEAFREAQQIKLRVDIRTQRVKGDFPLPPRFLLLTTVLKKVGT